VNDVEAALQPTSTKKKSEEQREMKPNEEWKKSNASNKGGSSLDSVGFVNH
jgi:hypothetical protein